MGTTGKQRPEDMGLPRETQVLTSMASTRAWLLNVRSTPWLESCRALSLGLGQPGHDHGNLLQLSAVDFFHEPSTDRPLVSRRSRSCRIGFCSVLTWVSRRLMPRKPVLIQETFIIPFLVEFDLDCRHRKQSLRQTSRSYLL